MSDTEVFQVVSAGSGATFQDGGRRGLAQYGVPPGGPMDDLAMGFANQLAGNTGAQVVIEAALTGLRLKALRDVVVAVTGTEGRFVVGDDVHDGWRTVLCPEGRILEIERLVDGVWTYIAVRGGFDAPRLLGSACPLPGVTPSKPIKRRDIIRVREIGGELPRGVAGRRVTPDARPENRKVVSLRVWPPPKGSAVSGRTLAALLHTEWTVSARCDRVAYQLNGPPLPSEAPLPHTPIPRGAVQIGPGGWPVVAMRDAPTLGENPIVGILDPEDIGRLAQCRTRQKVRFVRVRPSAQ